MKMLKLQNPDKYVGLYVVDFGDHTAVGFTAEETAELLESEKFKDCKVYKIHKAYPDGKIELKGVPAQTFRLEAGMFFYCDEFESAGKDYQKLINSAVEVSPPCRAKVHLAKYGDDKFAIALIYPAEYDDEVSSWLLDIEYKTTGTVEGGTSAVQRYYDAKPEILQRHQLFSKNEWSSRSGEKLLARTKIAIQR